MQTHLIFRKKRKPALSSVAKTGKIYSPVILYNFNHTVLLNDIFDELKRMRTRAVDLEELQRYGENNIGVGRNSLVVALGTCWNGTCGNIIVPCLSRNGSLGFFLTPGGVFPAECCFAVVRM